MRKVGIGIIGCGVISTAYLKAAQRFPVLEIKAVADMRSEPPRGVALSSVFRGCASISC
jgi:predicted dehydrogenase